MDKLNDTQDEVLLAMEALFNDSQPPDRLPDNNQPNVNNQNEQSRTDLPYNSRDPAGSQNFSEFSAAFSNLKNSPFYEDPKTLLTISSSTANDGIAENVPKTAASSSGGSGMSSAIAGRPVSSGAQQQGKSGPLLVSPKQRGNPLLKAICNVPWVYEEIVPDYQMGTSTCALFLSMRYHNLNPDYIYERLKKLGKKYCLQVLLVQVDVVDPSHSMKHLNRLSMLAGMTLMLAGSPEEAGRILETYKMFENKPADMIMEKKDGEVQTKVLNALTAVRSVNKTDAYTLLKTFDTLENILKASPEALELCPGFGPQKARRLHAVLHQPFLRRL